MALTKVILDGQLGKLFGKEWNLAASTPNQALSLIEANQPGIMGWIRSNREKYANYRVTITDHKGKKVDLSKDDYALRREQPRTIRFTPIVTGSSGAAKVVVGAILLVVSYFVPPLGVYLAPMGISLMIGGLVEILSPQPKSESNTTDDGTSYYFNGPVNTTAQGVPVPLVYGRCLVGSQSVSADITIDQLMD